jgi:flagellar basal-body rod protein FlgC
MSLLSLLSVSASGMAAQRARAEVLVENLANAETTRTEEGGPYRRKDVVFATREQGSPFSAVFQTALGRGASGVSVEDVVVSDAGPELRYQPGHPDADARGYVAFPRVNPAEEMVDLLSAARGYQANVSAMSAVKDMVQRSIELLK